MNSKKNIITKFLVIFIAARAGLNQQDQQECGLGCDSCISQSQCSSCRSDFIFYPEEQFCKYTNCDANLLAQEQQNQSNSSIQCVAICGENKIPNYKQNTCNFINQCSSSFSTEGQLNDKIAIISSGIYQNQFVLLIYDNFFNIFLKESGQFIKKILFDSSQEKILITQEMLFRVNYETSQISSWDLENDVVQLIYKCSKGFFTPESEFYLSSDKTAIITSFDAALKIIFFSIFTVSVQPIQSSSSINVLEMSTSDYSVIFQQPNFVVGIKGGNQINLQKIVMDNQQKYYLNALLRNTKDIMCSQFSDPKQMSDLGVVVKIVQVSENILIAQFSLADSLFQIEIAQATCQVVKNIVSPLQFMLAMNLTIQKQLLFVQYQNVIEVYSDQVTLIQSLSYPTDILDIAIAQIDSITQQQLYVLSSTNQLNIFQINTQSNQITIQSSIQLIIESATQLVIQLVTNQYALVFVQNYDCQVFDANTDTLQYILKSFETDYPSNKSKIVSLIETLDEKYLISASNDGGVVVWQILNKYKGVVELEYEKIDDDTCTQAKTYLDRYIIVICSKQIIIYDINNLLYKKVLPASSSSCSQNVSANSKYLLINQDNCIIKYDSNLNAMFKDCNANYNQLTTFHLSEDNTLITVSDSNKIQILDSNQTPLAQIAQYIHTASINQIKIRVYTDNTCKSLFVDSTLNLVLLNYDLTIQNTFTFPNILTIVDFNFPINSDNEDYFAITISNDPKDQKMYKIQRIMPRTSEIVIINSYSFATSLDGIIYSTDSNGDEFYYISPLVAYIYSSLFFQFSYNIQTGYIDYGSFPVIDFELITSDIVNTGINSVDSYIGCASGFVGYSPLFKQTLKQVHRSTSDQPISRVHQNLRLERYFIMAINVFVYNIHSDEFEEEIPFDDQTHPVKMFVESYLQRIILFVKDNQIIMKNYSNLQMFSYSTAGTIEGAFISDIISAVIVYGKGLNILSSSNLKQLSVLYPDSLISNCLFTDQLYVCREGTFNIIGFDPKKMQQIISFTVQNINSSFSIALDLIYSRIYVYDLAIQVYNFDGTLNAQLNEPTSNIIEFNFYGDKLVLATIGGGFIYMRESLVYQTVFYTQSGGVLRRTLYVLSSNVMVYITDNIRYGQVMFFSLKTLTDIGSFTNQSWDTNGVVTNLFYDPEMNEILYLDSFGNVANIIYSYGIYGDGSFILEYLFEDDKPVDIDISFPTNSYLIANSEYAYRIDYSAITKKFHRYIRQETQIFVQIQMNELTHFLIADKSNIIYKYNNFHLIYLTSFAEQIIDLVVVDENSQLVLIAFRQQLLVFKASSTSDKLSINLNQLYSLQTYTYKRYLCNHTFLTYDSKLIDYDFINQVQILSYSLQQSSDLLTSWQCLSDQSKIILAYFSGEVYIYDQNKKSVKELTNASLSSQPIINLTYTSTCIFAFQRNGNLLQLFEDPLTASKTLNKSEYINDSSDNQVNNAIFDNVYSRFYINFFNEQKVFVIDSNTLGLLKYLSYPNNEFNRISFGQNVIILYSIYQLNIYKRDTLEFIQAIIRTNRDLTIKDINLVQDTYLVIIFLTQVEVYILDNPSLSFQLIDTVITQNAQLLMNSLIINQFNFPILQIIYFSQDQVFEKQYSVNLLKSGSSQCSYSFQSDDSLDTEQKFLTVYKPNTNMQYTLFFEIGNSIEIFNQIEQDQIQLIIQPIGSSGQSSYSCQKDLNLMMSSFLSLQSNIVMNCFSFVFNESGIYSLNDASKRMILENISITNQSLENVKVQFSNMDTIILSNFTINSISSLKGKQQTQFQNEQYIIKIENCVNLNIYEMTISNIYFDDFLPIFLIKNVQSVIIKNLTIKNNIFSRMFQFESVSSLQIYNLSIIENTGFFNSVDSLSMPFVLEITGSKVIEIYSTSVKQNKNINMISSSNISEQKDMIMILSNDILKVSTLDATNNTFTDDFLSILGDSMFLLSNSYIYLDSVKYQNNESNISINSSKSVDITNSTFIFNTALNGGALNFNAISQMLTISNSLFRNNIATASGGAIFLYNVKALSIGDNTTIESNSALIGGGIRYIDEYSNSSQAILITISHLASLNQNVAEIYGNNIVSYPTKFKLQFTSSDTFMETPLFDQRDLLSGEQQQWKAIQLNNLQSGGYLNITIKFIDTEDNTVNISMQKYQDKTYPKSIIDDLKQLNFWVSLNENSDLMISDESLININQYDTNMKGLEKKNIQISGIPSTQEDMELNYSTSKSDQAYSITLSIHFRACQQGEIFKSVQDNVIQCQSCPNGFYSLAQVETKSQGILATIQKTPQYLDNIVCKKCPDSAQYCMKSEIKLKNGYWRSSNNTDEILECINNDLACIPESLNNKSGCDRGHIGPLCEQCDSEGKLWEERYTSSVSKFRCSQCSVFEIQVIYITGMLILILLYIIIQVMMFMNSYMHYQISYYFRVAALLPFSVSCQRDYSNFYLKILINYLQLSAILLHIKISVLPNIVIAGPSVFGNAVGNVSIDTNCLYSPDLIASYGKGRLRQITQSIIPPSLLLIIVALLYISQRFQLFRVTKYHKYTLLNFLFMFFQPDSLSLFSKSLTCRQIGSLTVLSEDMLFNCSDPGYNNFLRYFTIPNLLFWIFFPLIPFLALNKNRNRLNWCSVKLKLGYFYSEFKSEFFYWEFVRIYLKVLAVMLYTFFADNVLITIILVNLIITLYIISVIYFQPFQRIKLKNIEIMSSIFIIILIVLQGLNDQVNNIFFELAFMLCNFTFISYALYIIFAEKFSSPHNIICRLLKLILRKSLGQRNYDKFVTERKISIVGLLRWKKIKHNLSVLTHLKALCQVEMGSLNQKQNDDTKTSLRKQSSPFMQHSLYTVIDKIKQSLILGQKEQDPSCFITSREINNQLQEQKINHKKKNSLFSNQPMSLEKTILTDDPALSGFNSINQLFGKKGLQMSFQDNPRELLKSKLSALLQQKSQNDKQSLDSSIRDIGDLDQYNEVIADSTPNREVMITTYQVLTQNKTNSNSS